MPVFGQSNKGVSSDYLGDQSPWRNWGKWQGCVLQGQDTFGVWKICMLESYCDRLRKWKIHCLSDCAKRGCTVNWRNYENVFVLEDFYKTK